MDEVVSVLERGVQSHFTTLVLAVLYAMKLIHQKRSRDMELRYFWTPLLCSLLLVIEDMVEYYAAGDPGRYFLRVFASITGYALRPVAAVGLLLVICPREKRSWKLWIPCILNLAIFSTAFFSPIAFTFDENYDFIRGPLGYVVFVVAFLYIFQIFVVTWQRYYDGKSGEQLIIILCAASCILGSVVDMLYGGCRLNECIMISSIFFFFYLRSFDNRMDPLTALGNRFAFYDDIRSRNRTITAVASLDMNGLKQINDTQGHAAGDKALSEIGRCLKQCSARDTLPYRTGGDEFVMLFLHQNEDAVRRAVEHAKAEVARAGYSISTGFAMRRDGDGVEDTLQRSDESMYQDKAAYYQQSGWDRRRR